MNGAANAFLVIILMLASSFVIVRFAVNIIQQKPPAQFDAWFAISWILILVASIYAAVTDFYYSPGKTAFYELFYAASMWTIRFATLLLFQNLFHERNISRLLRTGRYALFVLYLPLIVIEFPCLGLGYRWGRTSALEVIFNIFIISHSVASFIFTILLIALPLPWVLPIRINESSSGITAAAQTLSVLLCLISSGFRIGYSIVRAVHPLIGDDLALWGSLEVCFNLIAFSIPVRNTAASSSDVIILFQGLLSQIWSKWAEFGKDDPLGDAEMATLIPQHVDRQAYLREDERQVFQLRQPHSSQPLPAKPAPEATGSTSGNDQPQYQPPQ